MAQAPAYFGKRQLIGGIALVLLLLLNVIVRDRNVEAVQAATAALDRSPDGLAAAPPLDVGRRRGNRRPRVIITGSENYLEPYNEALPRSTATWRGSSASTATRPSAGINWRPFARGSASRRRSSAPSSGDALRWATSGSGAAGAPGTTRATMDAVRTELDTIEAQAREDMGREEVEGGAHHASRVKRGVRRTSNTAC